VPGVHALPAELEAVLLCDVRRPAWRVLYANDAWAARSGISAEAATSQAAGGFWDQYELMRTLPGEAAGEVSGP